MNGSLSIILTRPAHDAGFVVGLGKADGWLACAIPGRDLKQWMGEQGAASSPHPAWHRGHVIRDDDVQEMTQDP
jgi:hypothetical protein